MRNTVIVLITLLTVILLLTGACSSPEPATAPEETREPTLTTTTEPTTQPTTAEPELTTEPTSESTTEPEPAPEPTTDPIPPPEIISFKLSDTADDLFDRFGTPVQGESYLDIIEVEIYDDGAEYVMVLTVNGIVPEETPDSELFFEWDIYIDVDCDPGTGNPWPLVSNDIGPEGFVRIMLIDMYTIGEVREFETDNSYPIEYKVDDNIITLRFRKFSQSDTFDFVVAIKKFGDRGDSDALILADKAPNQGHCHFPPEE